MLLAFITLQDVIPLLVFFGIVLGIWAFLSLVSSRNQRAEERLARISRSASLAEIEDPTLAKKGERFQGIVETAKALSAPLMPQTELEQNALKVRLANAGFRSDSASAVYNGLRLASLLLFFLVSAVVFLPQGFNFGSLKWVVGLTGLGFYLPNIILWWLRRKRQEAIFLSLPDALDLLVVCVESGLGLDAAMRKVCDEMKAHAKVIAEELALANFQLQMGRPRREVLHDLGVRTGVDDVRSLAAILIQADRFGSSIAQALRVQSDSMRTRRKQLAEEKAAKTAVQLIFPLVLFIFPGIFVVLVGPAAISIMKTMLRPQ
ncbi:MAG: type II secretion system F family protein [Acidobacteria bacterium]|nr:type II secretion system F family protein [Acidobacteriota bacterium]